MKLKSLSVLLCLAVAFVFSAGAVFAESYYPAEKSDKTAYRNFFGEGRGMTFYDEVLDAAKYPVPERLNDAAKSNGPDKHCSEANGDGALFLFKNAELTKDAEEAAIFYGYDKNHGGVKSANYYIYAAAPGTAQGDAVTESNLVCVLGYDKEQEIADEIATEHWEDFYDGVSGPMTAAVNLAKGTYDIYVQVEIQEDTVGDGDISAKLADLIFYAAEENGGNTDPGTEDNKGDGNQSNNPQQQKPPVTGDSLNWFAVIAVAVSLSAVLVLKKKGAGNG